MEFLTNLDNYNIFYEVAKTGNTTKASEKLFISQPAVTQAIKKLEDNLGSILFIRSKHGMTLTETGKSIYNHIESALNNISVAEQLIMNENLLKFGKINIGSGSNIARMLLSEPISAFCLDYPNIEINLKENTQSNMMERLKTGELNLVLTQKNEDCKFPFKPLLETKYCFITGTKCESNKFVMTNEGSYSYQMFLNYINKNNLQNTPTIHVSGYKIAIDLVTKGVGTTLVPVYIAEDYIKAGKVKLVNEDYTLPSVVFGVYHNPEYLTTAVKTFIEYLD